MPAPGRRPAASTGQSTANTPYVPGAL